MGRRIGFNNICLAEAVADIRVDFRGFIRGTISIIIHAVIFSIGAGIFPQHHVLDRIFRGAIADIVHIPNIRPIAIAIAVIPMTQE